MVYNCATLQKNYDIDEGIMATARHVSKDEKSSSTKQLRLHPLLPTEEEVKNGEKFLSDHLSRLIKINNLTIVTWNIHAPGAKTSGFNAEEKDEEIIERGKNIVDAIIKMIEKQQPDIILLQEEFLSDISQECILDISFNKRLKDAGSKTLQDYFESALNKKEWQFTYPMYILFDRKKLTATIDWNDKTPTVNITKDSKQYTLTNVCWPHNDIPSKPKERLKALLKPNSIVAGDFNTRIINTTATYQVGNVVSKPFSQYKQGVDFTDGAFYCNNEGFISQCDAYVLDPSTGDLYNLPEGYVADMKKRATQDPDLNKELLEYHLVLTFTPHPFLSNEKVIDALAKLAKHGVSLEPCVNAFGDVGVALFFEDAHLRNFIKKTLANNEIMIRVLSDEKHELKEVIFAPIRHARKLTNTIIQYYNDVNLIIDNIDSLLSKYSSSSFFHSTRKTHKRAVLEELKSHVTENGCNSLGKCIDKSIKSFPFAIKGIFSKETSTLLQEIRNYDSEPSGANKQSGLQASK